MEEILRMEHITKRFGDMYANRDISFDVRKGEVHTLLGENGAGKSTLMNVLFGLYQPTEGSIYIHGKKVRIDSPAQAVKQGIGMVHQHFMLVEAMTVLENIILGDRNTKGIFIDKDARRREIQKLADQYGLEVELDKPITEIAVGAQQRVEILKALYRGAELLVLDEPTAGLDPRQRVAVRNLIGEIAGEKIVLLCTHVVQDVEFIARELILMNQGLIIRRGSPHALEQELEGRVWELTAAEAQLPDMTQYGTVCGVSRQQEGILVRLLSEARPPLPCAPARPDLEDVYLFHFGEGAAL